MIDFSKIKTYGIIDRQNKFSLNDMIPLVNDRAIDHPEMEAVAEAVVKARQNGGKVIMMLGGAVIKVGCSAILIDLMEKGFIDHLAVNGAVSIHDFEIALIGATSEDVERGLEDGVFGMVEETGLYMNEAIIKGYHEGLGYGHAVGRKIREMDLPYKEHSLLYNALRYKIPLTVHIAVGGDIIHQHPTCNGAALGGTSFQDFKILTESVSGLKKGVLLNVGSAVNLPEVFLKALTIARNLQCDVRNFTTANFDFIDMYRPRTRLLEWPKTLGCQSFDIRANHNVSLPTMYRYIMQKLAVDNHDKTAAGPIQRRWITMIKQQLAGFKERMVVTEHLFVILVALAIGALAGFGTVLLRALIKEISEIVFWGSGDFLTNVQAVPWYVRLLAPAIGGLIVGPLIYFFAREAKRSGVPDVMQSVLLRGGYIRPRVALIKAITTSITIGTGGSVGREGPIVQIGSSIGSTLGQLFHVSSQRMKTFVGCGAAAGIAAAFNAPVAGALFAVEIILQDFAFAQFSPIVISSVMATVVSHGFKGNFAEFQLPEYTLTSYGEIGFYLIMAVLLALIGALFIKTIYLTEDVFEKHIRLPEYLKPALGGLLVGGIAIFFPDIMGIGYDSINNALHGKTLGILALVLVFVKILSTSLSLGAGSSGGVFAPSLFLGAMTGVFFGGIVHGLFPEITSDPGAYALVAMGGLVSAVTHAPITAIIMIFELTNNYTIILPLMVTCIVSTAVCSTLSRESVYTLCLLRRNVHIKYGSEIDVMKSLFVKDIYLKTTQTMREDTRFDQVVTLLLASNDPYFPVLDAKGGLCGIVSLNNIKEFLYEKDLLQDVLIAGDIAERNVVTVTPEEDCQTVLGKLTWNELQGAPVVDQANPNKLLGMIWRRDIYAAYHKEVKRRDLASSFASQITSRRAEDTVQFMEGYSLAEIPIPSLFVGRSIKDLNIRSKYGIDIILIRDRRHKEAVPKTIPSPDYVFAQGDSILVLGEIGKINVLKSL